jgi:hypothetical protein
LKCYGMQEEEEEEKDGVCDREKRNPIVVGMD